MEITIEQIKELRNMTGAGINAVRAALEASNGDQDAAIQYLREQGLAKAAKRAGREANNGILGVYIHPDSRMATIVEVASETDFAARSDEMRKFANDIALHVAAVSPVYINVDDIPAETLDAEKAVYAKDVEGKPTEIAEKIISGKLEKFYSESVLMHQKLFSNEEITVQDYMNELVAKIGEKLEITRFVRIQLAAPASQCGLK